MAEFTRRTSTTSSSSAPAAPACARPSRPSAAGVDGRPVCKSLLGKAHTVMAEGGIAAALANVDDRDSWKVHFADTMRGGQYVNNWRMAELHAQGGARPRARARGLGRGLRPHAGRPHPPAQLRRPPLSAPGARRRPHRPRDDPHAAGPRHPLGHRRAHGVHGHRRCSRTAAASPARSATTASAGASASSRAKAVVARHRRHRPRLQDHQQQLGVHRRRPRARLPRRRRADRHGVRPVPSRPAWSGRRACRASSSPKACAAKAASCATTKGERFMFDDIPENYSSADRRQRRRGLALHAGRQERAPSARAADARPRGALHHARGASAGRGSPHGGVFLDIAWIKAEAPERRGAHQEEAPEHVPPVQAAGRHRHHQGADGSRARPRTTSWAASASTPTRRCRRCRACSRPASARRASTAPTGSAATRSRTCWCSASAPASTRPSSRSEHGARPRSTTAQVEAAARAALAPFERGGERREPRTRSSTSCRR